MSLNAPRWWAALGGALLAHVVLIAGTIAWVAIYSYLIAPGQSVEAYEAYAQRSGPWVALVLGIPVFYLICRWLGRAAPQRSRATTIAMLAIYLGSDLALILAFVPVASVPWGLVALNYAAKAASGWWGGVSAGHESRAAPT